MVRVGGEPQAVRSQARRALPAMTAGLDAKEKRALWGGVGLRVLGTPVVAVVGLASTAITVRNTGPELFGFVSLVATLGLLLPFADLGIGAVVLSESSTDDEGRARQVIRRAYRVLSLVSAGLAALAIAIGVAGGWSIVLGLTSDYAHSWAVTTAVVLFALSIPPGLGVRILIGRNMNHVATLILMANGVFGLVGVVVIRQLDLDPIWYAVAAPAGVLCGGVVGTVVARRHLGRLTTSSGVHEQPVTRLLRGHGWLFVTGIAVPVGLQAGRIVLSHLSSPTDLSQYALGAQFYALAWTVFSTAGLAFWPVFVRRRAATDRTVAMWRTATSWFALGGVVGGIGLATLGPTVATLLSENEIDLPYVVAAAFGLLLAVQCTHLPTGVLLTSTGEARWQAMCVVAMAVLSVGGAVLVAPTLGAAGVVCAAAAAVLIAQIVPDQLFVPALVDDRAPRARHRKVKA
ncbi:lipopolysaccharide biosynthesis protein [Actinomycetes bacterium M1A6_2h]